MITISDYGNSITITRNGVTRTYPSFIPTAGQMRLYALLRRNADRFEVKPYSFTAAGQTVTATVSKIYTLKVS